MGMKYKKFFFFSVFSVPMYFKVAPGFLRRWKYRGTENTENLERTSFYKIKMEWFLNGYEIQKILLFLCVLCASVFQSGSRIFKKMETQRHREHREPRENKLL